MNDLTQAVAFLESLNLAHGDLRPENVLLDRSRLKLSDFDSTATIGTICEVYTSPYGRLLNDNEPEQGERGTYGHLGPRTEQFALGSIYYYINYGFELYENRLLTEDPHEHGPETLRLLQKMEFPELDGNDPLINAIIDKCWHNKYVTVAELAECTQALLDGSPGAEESHGVGGGGAGGDRYDLNPNNGVLSKKTFCQDLEKRELLDLLCSGEPEELGFTLGWYRHSLRTLGGAGSAKE
jgi:serine/threonine protein kinase